MNPRVRIYLSMAAVLVAVVFLFRETAFEVFGIWWRSDTFAHGLLVLPISAGLAWRARGRLEGLTPRPSLRALIPLSVAALGWLLGAMANAASVTHFFLALILMSAEVAVLGGQISRVLAFPLLFILFGVPIGEFLLPIMMDYTAEFTVSAVRASGVPVYQEGLHFVVPNGRWSVVEACSGVRYLIASLMVGTLYAYLTYRSLKRRVLFVLVALLVPVLANWLRAYMIVMLGYLSGNRIATGVDHLIYGWVFFGVVILLMFSVGGRWREDLDPEPACLPLQPRAPLSRGAAWARVAAVAVLLAALPWLGHRLELQGDASRVPTFAALQPQSPWALASGNFSGFKPSFEGFRSEQRLEYVNGSAQVGLYVAVYGQQSQGHELVHFRNMLLSPHDRVYSRRKVTSGPDSGHGHWLESVISGKNEIVLTWSGYWIDGHLLTNEYLAKALLLRARLLGKPDTSAFVTLWSSAMDEASAHAQLQAFYAAHGSQLLDHLNQLNPGP
ncbi:exosortase A [Zoogloea sp.]|uniref:exosortase A n=1 Tax=Zoogloea sp. TaxID=49181 RepID=UPI0035B38415